MLGVSTDNAEYSATDVARICAASTGTSTGGRPCPYVVAAFSDMEVQAFARTQRRALAEWDPKTKWDALDPDELRTKLQEWVEYRIHVIRRRRRLDLTSSETFVRTFRRALGNLRSVLKKYPRRHLSMRCVRPSSRYVTFVLSDETLAPRTIPKKIGWDDDGDGSCSDPSRCVLCDPVTPTIRAGNCSVGSKNNVFYRSAKNLRDFVERLETLPDADELLRTLYRVFVDRGISFYNHNLDIDFLHFKPCHE